MKQNINHEETHNFQVSTDKKVYDEYLFLNYSFDKIPVKKHNGNLL